jgi:hypothetical protein
LVGYVDFFERIGYVNLDYACDLDMRRSLPVYVLIVGGCVVRWKSCLHYTIAMSTTEVEYMIDVEAAKEVLWLKDLYSELCEIRSCITIHSDSQSAIYLTKDHMLTERTNHSDI